MTDHPSPEDARRLLEGTTPGPWEYDSESGCVIAPVGQKPTVAVLRYRGDYPDARLMAAAPALAAALAEHEAEECAGCARVEALAAAREARAEVAALRTEREEAVRLLWRAYEWTRHAPCVADGTCVHCAVDAFLARTDTGGQE